MAPQKRGVVPDRIRAAQEAVEAAQLALERAVADALKGGGSIREVTAATGLASQTVQSYGRRHGWPTKEQQAARDAAKDRRARIKAILDEA